MNLNALHSVGAACIGIITIFGTAKALREYATFGRASYPIAVCSGILSFIGLVDMGKLWTGLLIPWMTLGIVLAVLMLIRFFGGIVGGRFPLGGGSKVSQEETKGSVENTVGAPPLVPIFRISARLLGLCSLLLATSRGSTEHHCIVSLSENRGPASLPPSGHQGMRHAD